MKKIKYLLVLLLMLPIFVKADGGGPVSLSFDAVVTNPDGAALYEWEDDDVLAKTSKVLKFQKRIKISYEEEINNKSYGIYSECREEWDDEWDEYNDVCDDYYVDMNNLSVDKEEFTLKDLNKFIIDYEGGDNSIDSDVLRIYIDHENVKLKKGPSSLYKDYDYEVEVGSIYKVEAEVSGWYYISNGNKKGWISSDENWFCDYGRKVWVLDDAQVFSKIGTKIPDVKVPGNTKFDNAFIYEEYLGYDDETEEAIIDVYYLVNYNNEYLIISGDDVADEFTEFDSYYDDVYHTDKMVTLYSIDGYINYYDVKSNIDVPQNTEIETLYTYKNRLYIKYGNKYAWIRENEDFATTGYLDKILTVGKFKLYDKYNGKNTIEIGPNIELEQLYSYYEDDDDTPCWYAVKYNNKIYWINSRQYYATFYDPEEYEDEDEEDNGHILLGTEKNIYNDIFDKDAKDKFTAGEDVKILYYFWDDLYEYKKSLGDFTGCTENTGNNYWYDEDESNPFICEERWYFVDDGKKTGWISGDSKEMKDIADKIMANLLKEKEEKENKKENKEPEKIVVEKKKLSQKELIYVCAFGALALCVVAIVTIKLVNKKKNKGEVVKENTEEVKAEETNTNGEIKSLESNENIEGENKE